MSSELKIMEEVLPEFVSVGLCGEVDISSSQTFKDKLYKLIEDHKKNIKLDCTGLTYIDSTGLGILVGALKKTKQSDNTIIIKGLKDNIKKLFYITGLDKIFVIEE
jgi:anti-anti-sigma factor